MKNIGPSILGSNGLIFQKIVLLTSSDHIWAYFSGRKYKISKYSYFPPFFNEIYTVENIGPYIQGSKGHIFQKLYYLPYQIMYAHIFKEQNMKYLKSPIFPPFFNEMYTFEKYWTLLTQFKGAFFSKIILPTLSGHVCV